MDASEHNGGPRLSYTQNARFTRADTIVPFPRLTNVTSTQISSGVSSAFPGSQDPQFLATFSRGATDEVLLGCSNRLLTLDSAGFYDRGVLAPFTLRRLAGSKELLDTSIDVTQGVKGTSYDMLLHSSASTIVEASFLGDAGQVIGSSTIGFTLFDAAKHNGEPAVVLYSGGTIVLRHFGAIPPVVTDITIGADWGAAGIRAFWEPTENACYVVYGTTVANQVKLAKVTSGGVVTSATFALGGAVASVAVTASAGKVLVAARTGATITSKVYSTALVDQAINQTHSGSSRMTLGCTDELGWIAVDQAGVYRRSMTAASTTTIGLKANVRYTSHIYMLNSRAYVAATEGDNQPMCIVDVTDVSDTWVTAARLLHATEAGAPTPFYDGYLGLGQYITFDVDGGVSAAPGFYRFEQVPAKATSYADCLYFSGSCPTVYDGMSAVEQGFNATPFLTATVAAGGTLTAGSYTYQVTYKYVNAAGQVERSAPSLPITATTAAGNLTLNISITPITLTNKTNVRVELWRTEANPGSNAPLYLLADLANSLVGTAVTYADNAVTATLTSNEILYTVGNVLDQEPVNADAGFTTVGGRLWGFAANRVWVSNQAIQNQAPWFSEITGIQTSSEYGVPRAIGCTGDKVFLFYANGVMVTGGPGYNELGQGQGFATPQIIGRIPGPTTARGVVEIPGSVAFQSGDRLMLVSDNLNTSLLSFPDNPDLFTPVASDNWDLAANQGVDELYVTYGGRILVFNYRALGWSAVSSGYRSVTVANNRVYFLADTDFVFQAVEGNFGTSMTIVTNWIRPTGQGATNWSRVREVSVVGKYVEAHEVAIRPQYDGSDEPFLSYEGTTQVYGSDSTETWPTGAYRPTLILSRQKCQQVRFLIEATQSGVSDGIAEFYGLELKVRPTDNLSPGSSRNRALV